MRSIGMKSFAIVALAAAYSHAIFGIGGQWAPAPGVEVDADNAVIVDAPVNANDITLEQSKVDGLNGFGFKIWIDFLPFVDLEATTNLQYGYYDLTVVQGNNRVVVDAPIDVPFVDERPAYARSLTDLSILYPFLKLPPVVSIAKIYAGGGLTYCLSTAVLNSETAKKAIDKATAAGQTVDTPQEVAAALSDVLVDEGLSSGVGFHLMAGIKAKPPIIPLAAFANIKYHFIGSQPSGVSDNSLTYELGGALDF